MIRSDWTLGEAQAIHDLPFPYLIHRAQDVHRRHFDPTVIETASLLSIKTGGCPEDCGYCSQSAHHDTGVKATKLMELEAVLGAARRAKASGAQRFCMGAAWRSPKDRDMDKLCAMVEGVRDMGLETCMTLGMLSPGHVERLKAAGLDFYNHNIDTSESYYNDIISTRTFDDRLDTLAHVRKAGMTVCSGGIIGMGETDDDRIAMLHTLATLPQHPESVPINALVPVEGTPLGESQRIPFYDLVRMIATVRIVMPKTAARLSAGRLELSLAEQGMCFLAGANSIFAGDKLLTTPNPEYNSDMDMFRILGLRSKAPFADQPARQRAGAEA